MAWRRWVLPRPVPPWRKSGLKATSFAVARAVAAQDAGVRIENAERDRAQPAVERAGAAIAAKAGANRFPGVLERIAMAGVPRAGDGGDHRLYRHECTPSSSIPYTRDLICRDK